MTLRQIEVFLAVARAKSFSVAAKRIHAAQPTMSEHVGELERELGRKLFIRQARTVAVTEAGRVFEQYAEQIITAVEGARQALNELDGLTHGSLLIGASSTPGLYVVPPVVAAFRTRYPGVQLKLEIANSRLIEERVKDRALDLGIVGGHAVAPGEECLAAGLIDELVLVVPPTHPLAKRGEIRPERLAEYPLLLREEGSATRSVTERALQRAGAKFTTLMELDHTEAIKQSVMAGFGVAFVSTYAVHGEIATGRLCAVRLRGVRVRRHFHVIHHESRRVTASARAFIALLEQTPGATRPAKRR
jgi:LysR family transcriptional regulator, low CO2-responsive transcriptional regulator